eukprot:1231513-Rhodomonas_salina.2
MSGQPTGGRSLLDSLLQRSRGRKDPSVLAQHIAFAVRYPKLTLLSFAARGRDRRPACSNQRRQHRAEDAG